MDVSLNLDGTGLCSSSTKIPFLDHMMDQLASHGLFDVMVDATGDTWIDDHHTNEDIALALGTTLSNALGDRKGIHRFGDFTGEEPAMAILNVQLGRDRYVKLQGAQSTAPQRSRSAPSPVPSVGTARCTVAPVTPAWSRTTPHRTQTASSLPPPCAPPLPPRPPQPPWTRPWFTWCSTSLGGHTCPAT